MSVDGRVRRVGGQHSEDRSGAGDVCPGTTALCVTAPPPDVEKRDRDRDRDRERDVHDMKSPSRSLGCSASSAPSCRGASYRLKAAARKGHGFNDLKPILFQCRVKVDLNLHRLTVGAARRRCSLRGLDVGVQAQHRGSKLKAWISFIRFKPGSSLHRPYLDERRAEQRPPAVRRVGAAAMPGEGVH